MKAADFQELLESVRDAGAYSKGNRKAVARTDHASPQSAAAPTTGSGRARSHRGRR